MVVSGCEAHGLVHDGLVFDGGSRPSRVCRRRGWYVLSIQVPIAMRSSSRVRHRLRSGTFFCRSAKKESIAALSPAAPTLPIHPMRWWRFRACTKLRARN